MQPHEPTDSRTPQRNGTRARLLSTKAGDVEFLIPKLREGSFFPTVLERRRRIDRALFRVVMEAYVAGVSTRKVDDLLKSLGLDSGISKSEVSRICKELDDELEAFRTPHPRPRRVSVRARRRGVHQSACARPCAVPGGGRRHRCDRERRYLSEESMAKLRECVEPAEEVPLAITA